MARGVPIKYTAEMTAWIRAYGDKDTDRNNVEKFNALFKTDLVRRVYTAKRERLGVPSFTGDGRFKKGNAPANKGKKMSPGIYEKCKKTMFKPGSIPPNLKPLGSERIDKDGYTMIKVKEGNKTAYRLKQRVLYEQYYGIKLKRDDVVLFLDGDKNNFDKDNLEKITRAELARINHMFKVSDNPDITRINIDLAMLSQKTSKLKKRRLGNEKAT